MSTDVDAIGFRPKTNTPCISNKDGVSYTTPRCFSTRGSKPINLYKDMDNEDVEDEDVEGD